MTAGNLLVGGVIGIGVDAMSGAINKYPDIISVPMIPIPACGVPPPVYPGRNRGRAPPVAALRPPVAPPPPQLPPQAPEPQLSESDRVMNSRN
jgi:hypothetical protein